MGSREIIHDTYLSQLDMHAIPTWLLRGHPDCRFRAKKVRERKPALNMPSVSKAAQAAIDRRKALRERREKEAQLRAPVLSAVKNGADTFGKVRKATDIPASDNAGSKALKAVIRQLVRHHKISKRGKRYLVG